MKFAQSLAALAAALFSANLALAQGVGASGTIRGTVTDPSGAVITQANITVVDQEKGVRRTAATDNAGDYQVAGLPPTSYEIRLEKSGFETEIHKGVVVNIGQTTTVDFHLKISTAKEAVEVTTEPPVVDTDRGHQAAIIDQQYIKDLPINQRDYLTFALLLPQTSNSQSFDGADYRVRQTPQTGLSYGGSNGRGNNVTVDGGQFNGDSGAVEVNLSQDAVQEFQVNLANYGADSGAASGASINIVSKSGTNNFHGTVYGFFRNDAMDARNPFAFTNALNPGQLSAATGFTLNAVSQPTKDTLSRQQYGATLGFPLQKDKTFMFLGYEGLREKAQTAVPLLTNSSVFAPQVAAQGNDQKEIIAGLAAQGATSVPCLTNGSNPPIMRPAAVCAAILQSLMTINPASSALEKFLVNMFETNGGLFPNTTINNYWSGRLDHTFSDANQAYLRYLYTHSNIGNPDVGALIGVSRGSTVQQYTSSLQAAWFHQFSAKSQNELRAQWNLTNFNVYSNDPGGPALDLGAFQFGRDRTLPDFTTLRQYEFADNVTLVHGRHTMKFGFAEVIRGDKTQSATFMGGDFSFGALPGGIVSPCLQVPAACGLVGLTPAVFDPLQAFKLGLPSFYQQGFGNPITTANLPLTSVFWQDSWALKPNFSVTYGARYELDSRDVMPTDHLNFAPRISFAWDPFKNHKTVVRGGLGVFYSPTYVQIDFSVKELGVINGSGPQIANFLIPLTNPGPVNAASIFQTLFAQGKIGGCGLSSGPKGAGNGACVTAADLAQFGINVTTPGAFSDFFHLPTTFHNPYSEQGSFGIEHQIANGMSISANYIYVHTLRLPRTVDTNLLPSAPFVSGVSGTNGLPFQTWSAPQCSLIINNPCFANPGILGNNTYASDASSVYNGGSLEFKKRFSQHYTLMANYTWSKAMDDNTDFNISYAANNQVNLAADHSLSSYDQRHKIVIAGILQSPWKNPVASGFQFSPIFRYSSGHPYNLLAGSDVNGDRNPNTDRPPGAGRNTGLGPNNADFDARLSRTFKIGERTGLQFMAEAFNLFNRTNYSSVNNSVGASFAPSFNVQGVAAPITNSLGLTNNAFTQAFAKRQIQLGARVSF